MKLSETSVRKLNNLVSGVTTCLKDGDKLMTVYVKVPPLPESFAEGFVALNPRIEKLKHYSGSTITDLYLDDADKLIALFKKCISSGFDTVEEVVDDLIKNYFSELCDIFNEGHSMADWAMREELEANICCHRTYVSFIDDTLILDDDEDNEVNTEVVKEWLDETCVDLVIMASRPYKMKDDKSEKEIKRYIQLKGVDLNLVRIGDYLQANYPLIFEEV